MDTTPKYIKMCEMAGEIQKLRDYIYKEGDYCYCLECGLFIHTEKGKLYDLNGIIIWLPRQDQLDQLQEKTEINADHRFDSFPYACVYCLNKFLDYELPSVDTIEQLYLMFVMKEKFNKTWDDKEEIWRDYVIN